MLSKYFFTALKKITAHAQNFSSTLYVFDYKRNEDGLSELKILVSVVRFRPGPPRNTGTYRTHALRPVPTTWFTPLPITSPILWDQMGFLGLVPAKTPYQSKPYRNP